MARWNRSAALRVLIWGLVAIVLVLTTVAGVMAVRRTSDLVGRVSGPATPSVPSASQPYSLACSRAFGIAASVLFPLQVIFPIPNSHM